jgi:hypothetical protein
MCKEYTLEHGHMMRGGVLLMGREGHTNQEEAMAVRENKKCKYFHMVKLCLILILTLL